MISTIEIDILWIVLGAIWIILGQAVYNRLYPDTLLIRTNAGVHKKRFGRYPGKYLWAPKGEAKVEYAITGGEDTIWPMPNRTRLILFYENQQVPMRKAEYTYDDIALITSILDQSNTGRQLINPATANILMYAFMMIFGGVTGALITFSALRGG